MKRISFTDWCRRIKTEFCCNSLTPLFRIRYQLFLASKIVIRYSRLLSDCNRATMKTSSSQINIFYSKIKIRLTSNISGYNNNNIIKIMGKAYSSTTRLKLRKNVYRMTALKWCEKKLKYLFQIRDKSCLWNS